MMKNYVILGLGMCVAFSVTSCKSSESAYKKAYEKAKLQEQQDGNASSQTAVVEVTPVVPTTPVQPTTPANPTTDNTPVRQEKVTVVSGAGLQDYSVVCGSFGVKANAEGMQSVLKGKGYQAQIAYNSVNSMYRVIATTFADKSAAVKSRDELRASYPDAWLLFNK